MQIFKILLFIVSANFLFASSVVHFTQEEISFIQKHKKKKILIGSMNSYTPFSFIRNGKKVGFTQDLIEIISKESGLQFEKTGGSWPEIFQKFKNGSIDMISELSFNKERLSYTIYSDPYYEIPIGVFTKKDFGKYLGIISLENQRIAILKNSFIKPILKKIPGVQIIEVSSHEEKFYALKNDEADAVLSSSLYLMRDSSILLDNVKLSGYFNHCEVKKEDLRFGIQKNNPLLASIINKTLQAIPYSTLSELKNRWFYEDNRIKPLIDLTPKEIKWIKNNTVSIGIEDAKPYIYFDRQTKNIDGLYSDILKLVIQKTGIKTDFIEGSWDSLFQDFKEKKLDLLPATFYSKKREKYGYFSYPFYKVREYIYIQNNNRSISSFHDLANKKVAIVKNYATIEKLREKFPQIRIIETKNLTESTGLLLNGKVDALVDYHLVVENYLRENSIVGIKGVAQSELYATSVHFLSHIDKPILRDILQKGLNEITREEESKILRQWVRLPYNEIADPYALTKKEQEFINNHPVIRFRVRPQSPPFEFERNGQALGIAVDYVKKSAQNVGLQVKFIINDDPISKAFEIIETTRDTYDTLLYNVKNPQREQRFSYGIPFLSYPMMIITHRTAPYITSLNDLQGQTIALEKGFLTNQWIKRDYPNIKIKTVDSTKEALQLVNDERVFAYIGNLGVASYMNKFSGMANIKVAAPTEYGNINFNFIAPKEWIELTSLLSKGYKKITPVEHSSIQQKWFALQTIEKTNYTLLFQVLLGAAFIILWISWWSRKVTVEKNKTKQALEQLKIAQEEKLQSQQLLFNQSKIAAMGEMIGNIAHQWRQPLSVISTASTGALMQKEVGLLDDDKLKETLRTINEHAQYLSSTIDTFRDYIKTNKEYKEVILQDRIKLSINIIRASFENNYITIKTNMDTIEPIKIKLVVGELSEVMINILNNAKDAIKETKPEKPWVDIQLQKFQKKVIVSVEDNAGGIPEDILPRIFDPYFTTKHQTQGTGLGLHMSYKIITESLKGNIYVRNTRNGAKVFIELPLIK